jgi:hypothetical protein
MAFVFAGCSALAAEPAESQSPTTANAAAIRESARAFMQTVARSRP